MKIITFNVNGLKSYINHIKTTHNMDLSTFISIILKCDILCIQEVRASIKQYKEIEYFGNHVMYTNHHKIRNGYCGVSIIVNKKTFINSIKTDFKSLGDINNHGRLIQADFGNFKVLNIYFPYICQDDIDTDKRRTVHNFYAKIGDLIDHEENTIICGDFNAVYQIKDHYQFKDELNRIKLNFEKNNVLVKDKIEKKWYSQTELPFIFRSEESLEEYLLEMPQRKWLHDFVNRKSHIDSFEYVDKIKHRYTCWNAKLKLRERDMGTRIDYIFVPVGYRDMIKKCSILGDVYGSDHCPVLVEIGMELGNDIDGMNRKRNTIHYFLQNNKNKINN